METSLSTAIAPVAGPQKRRRKGIFVLLSRKEPLSNDVLPTGDRAFAVRTRRRGWKGILRPFGRKVVPIADVGASIAEAIPILGAPVKGVLDALVKTLKMVEQQHQNEESIQQLLEKIETLNEHLGVNATSSNLDWLGTKIRRETQGRSITYVDEGWEIAHQTALLPYQSFVAGIKPQPKPCRLEKAEQHLKQLTEVNGLDYANVAATVSQCERDITTYLATFSAAEHFETQAMVKVLGNDMNLSVATGFAEMQAEFARQREYMITSEERLALFVSGLVGPRRGPSPLYIKVVDPFGIEHMLLQIPGSSYELGLVILERCKRNPIMYDILAGFVDANYLDVCLDDGHAISPMGDVGLSALVSDSTIVVSAILLLDVLSVERMWCPVCWDYITPGGGADGQRVICEACNRNVLVIPPTMHANEPPHPLSPSSLDLTYGCFKATPLRPQYLGYLNQISVYPQLASIVGCFLSQLPRIELYYKHDTTAHGPPGPVAFKPVSFNEDANIDYWAPLNVRLEDQRNTLFKLTRAFGKTVLKVLLDLIRISEVIEGGDVDRYVDDFFEVRECMEEDTSLENEHWLERRLTETHSELWYLITTNDLNRYAISRTIPQHDEHASSLARAFLANLSRHAPFSGILGFHPFGPHRMTMQGSQGSFADIPIVASMHRHFNLGTPAARQALSRLLHASRASRPGAKGTGSSTERPTRVLECPACGTIIVSVLGDDKRVLCRTCDEEVQAVPSILGEPYQGNMLPQGRLFAVRSYVGTTFSPWPLGFHRFSTTPVAVQGAMPWIFAGLGRERPISV